MTGIIAAIAMRWAALPAGARRLLRGIGIGLAIIVALAIAIGIARHRHAGEVARVTRAARAAGRAEQAAVDRAAVIKATIAARQAQARLVAATAAAAATINKDIDHAHQARDTDLARRYAALRLSWQAARAQGHSSGAGQGAAAAIPGAAEIVGDAACRAAGWLDFETAATIAEAADRGAAQVNGLLDWHAAQAAAWPKPDGAAGLPAPLMKDPT